jgi:uncharacterized membrane protein
VNGVTQNVKADQMASPADRLKAEAIGLVGALGDRAMASVRDRVQSAAGRLTDYVEDGAGPGLMAAVTGAKDLAAGKSPVRALLGAGMTAAKQQVGALFGGGGQGGQGGGKGRNLKVTNIVETIDIGAPLRLTYDQWTQFADFPSFMKKVENVEQAEEATLNWKAQVFWSHRTWESTILEQVPDDKIIWRSKGAKGHVDGAVTFHELAPSLTRILVVLEYHPQGLFEHTGNIWRAQGRRARLELKHFRRHVMTEVLLHPDEVEGWRGVIRDGEVVPEDDEAQAGQDEYAGDESRQDEDTDEAPDDEYADEDQDNQDQDDQDQDNGTSQDQDQRDKAGQKGRADRRDRRRPADGGRQPERRRQPGAQRPRAGRAPERPDAEDRSRRVTRRAESRGGARS